MANIRILVLGDRHNCETPPVSRIDDYAAACEEKDNFILNLAKQYKVDAIIHPGDFWTDADRKPTNEFVGRVAAKWLSAGVPIVGIPGNHDLIGGDPESLSKTTCGLLNTLGIFKTLVNGEEYHISRNDIDVCITGTSYHKDQDKSECVGDYIVGEKKGNYHIHLTHGMLTPTDLGPKIRHTTIEAIKGTAADVTICGHDHSGFGVVECAGKLFMNPGSVLRMSCRESELIRKPCVILLTISKTGIKYEQIDLPAKPASEALTRDYVEAERRKQQFASDVQQSMARLKLGGSAIQSILEEIYKRDSIPEDVRTDLKARIEANTASLKNRTIAPENAHICRVTLHNFQSHADTTIELNDGLNVVLGESHAGKSAMLRGIRWVAENKPTGRSMIRKDTDECYVEISLENGTVIRRFINNNDNGYRITKPDGQILSGNTKMVDTVQALMGWNSMTVGLNEEIGINHLSQSASPTLIGDRYSGSDRSRIIGAINNTDGCDETVDQYALENSRLMEKKKHIEDKTAELGKTAADCIAARDEWNKAIEIVEMAVRAESIEAYLNAVSTAQDASAEYNAIASSFDEKQLNELLREIESLIRLRDQMVKELRLRDDAIAAIAERSAEYAVFGNIAELEETLKQAEQTLAMRDRISEEYAQYDKQVKQIKRCLLYKKPIDAAKLDDMDTIEELFSRRAEMIKLTETAFAADKTIAEQRANVLMLDTVASTAEYLNETADLIRTRTYISNAYTAYRSAGKDVSAKSAEADKAEANLVLAKQSLATALAEAHVCPVCGTVMDNEVIAKVVG